MSEIVSLSNQRTGGGGNFSYILLHLEFVGSIRNLKNSTVDLDLVL